MRCFSTGGTYVNFLTEEKGDERIHAAYGVNYGRLVELKKEVESKQSVSYEQEHSFGGLISFGGHSSPALAVATSAAARRERRMFSGLILR